MARSLGQLTLDLILRAGGFETDMGRAARLAEREAKNIDRAIAGMRSRAVANVAGFVGAFVSAQAAVTAFNNAVTAADRLDELSAKLGISTEKLSAWGYAAKMTGTDLESVNTSLDKLSKSAAAALDAGSRQGKMFKALGVDVRDANGNLRAAEDLLPEIADGFKAIHNDTLEAAVAMELFGKSGAQMLEFLNLGSSGLDDMASRAKALGIVIDGETAAAAAKFKDEVDNLKAATQGVTTQIAAGMLPAVTDLTIGMSEYAAEGNNAVQVGEMLGGSLSLVASVAGVVAGSIRTVTVTIAELLNQASSWYEIAGNIATFGFAPGSVGGGLNRSASGWSTWLDTFKDEWFSKSSSANQFGDVRSNVTSLGGRELKLAEARMKLQKDAEERLLKLLGGDGNAAKNGADAAKKREAELRKLADAQAKWTEEIERTGAQLQGSLKVAEYERDQRLQQIAAALKYGTINEAQATEARAQAGEQYRRQTEDIERNLAAQRERADVMGRLRATMQEEIRLSAMSTEQRRIEEMVLRTLSDAKHQNVEVSEAEARAVVAAADAQIRANEAHVRSLEDLQHAGVNAFLDMTRAMGDFVGRGFKGVKDMWSQIKDAFKRGVSDVVAIMLNAKFVQPFQNWLSQLLGMGGQQGAGGIAMNGQGGLGAVMNNGFDRLLSGFSSLFGRGGAATTSIAQGVGSLLPDAVKAGAAMAQQAGASGGSGMFGAAGAAGSFAKAIPVIGWIYAGMQMAGNLYNKGWDVNGQRNDIAMGTLKTGDLGLAISAGMTLQLDRLLRSIGVGGKWASIISGSSLLAAAFGRKKPEVTGSGITGSYGFDGFNGQSYADIKQKGGWFRSDKKWTEFGAMDAELDRAFDTAATSVRDAAKKLAEQAGMDISAQLAGVSVSIGKMQLSSNAEEAQKQIEGVLDAMIETLSSKSIEAMGFGGLLDDGYKATEIMGALSSALALVTGEAGKLERSLTALEVEKVQLTVEWFEKFAKTAGTTLSEGIQKAIGLMEDYSSLIGGVRQQIATRGLNQYQKAQLDVELAYRAQVKQANELAKALGLSGARAEDLAAIEQLRALNMADLAAQYAKQAQNQNQQWLQDLGMSNLSPLRDDQKLAAGMASLREAVGAGDAQRAQKLAEQVLGLGRDLYASGADYNALYNQVTGLVGGMDVASMEELQGLTNEQLATLADLVSDLPSKIAQELAAVLVAPPTVTEPAPLPPAPTPAPPPPGGGGGGGYDSGYDAGYRDDPKIDRDRRMIELLSEIASSNAEMARGTELDRLDALNKSSRVGW